MAEKNNLRVYGSSKVSERNVTKASSSVGMRGSLTKQHDLERVYEPSSKELIRAIELILNVEMVLNEVPLTDVKQIHTALLKQNSTWKLSENKVANTMLKIQRAKKGNPFPGLKQEKRAAAPIDFVRVYEPKKGELVEEIEAVLREGPNNEAAQIQDAILAKNKSWKVSEVRVSKIMAVRTEKSEEFSPRGSGLRKFLGSSSRSSFSIENSSTSMKGSLRSMLSGSSKNSLVDSLKSMEDKLIPETSSTNDETEYTELPETVANAVEEDVVAVIDIKKIFADSELRRELVDERDNVPEAKDEAQSQVVALEALDLAVVVEKEMVKQAVVANNIEPEVHDEETVHKEMQLPPHTADGIYAGGPAALEVIPALKVEQVTAMASKGELDIFDAEEVHREIQQQPHSAEISERENVVEYEMESVVVYEGEQKPKVASEVSAGFEVAQVGAIASKVDAGLASIEEEGRGVDSNEVDAQLHIENYESFEQKSSSTVVENEPIENISGDRGMMIGASVLLVVGLALVGIRTCRRF